MAIVASKQQTTDLQTVAQKKPKKKRKKLWHWLPFYLMGLPGLAYLFINNYMPLVGLQIAFKNFNYSKGMWDSPWNNFKNFQFPVQER